jgi:hypothetical protein
MRKICSDNRDHLSAQDDTDQMEGSVATITLRQETKKQRLMVAVGHRRAVEVDVVAPGICRLCSGTRRIFVFGLGKQAICFARDLRQPCHVLPRVVPIDVEEGTARRLPAMPRPVVLPSLALISWIPTIKG